MSEILNFKNVSITLNKKNFFNLNFTIRNGDFFLIGGDNASGKSLLLKLLYLKTFPDVGDIYLFGKKKIIYLMIFVIDFHLMIMFMKVLLVSILLNTCILMMRNF